MVMEFVKHRHIAGAAGLTAGRELNKNREKKNRYGDFLIRGSALAAGCGGQPPHQMLQ
jgi:hypothetical protein